MRLPSAEATGSTQERTALPSRCTVQAPHIATPHPYLVPVRPTCSRIAHRRGVLGLTLTSWVLPLMVRRAMVFPPRIVLLYRGLICTLRHLMAPPGASLGPLPN